MIFSFVACLRNSDRVLLNDFITKIGSVEIIEIDAEYMKGPYYYVELSTYIDKTEKVGEVILYILKNTPCIFIRAVGSPYIFVSNEQTLEQLKEEQYWGANGVENLKRDVLGIEERYFLIFKSSSYLERENMITLLYEHPRGYGTYDIPLTQFSKELFSSCPEYQIMNDMTGEIHAVDITFGIPEHYFKFIVLKNLEKK